VTQMPDTDGWETYSNLVLQQLELLAGCMEDLRGDFQDLKTQIIELKAKEDRIQDIKIWKEKLDDIASPSQLKTVLKEIEVLKQFKTKAITVFMVIQAGMAFVLAWSKMF